MPHVGSASRHPSPGPIPSRHSPGRPSSSRAQMAATALLAALCVAPAVQAQALKYTPTNPHFGGSPFNGAELMSSAAAQRSIKSPTAKTELQTFATSLEARISAGLAQYISNQLFSANGTGGNSGTVTLGNLVVSYERKDKTVEVTLTDPKTGEKQTVVYPLGIFIP